MEQKKVFTLELTELEALRLVTALTESICYLQSCNLRGIASFTELLRAKVRAVVYSELKLLNISKNGQGKN